MFKFFFDTADLDKLKIIRSNLFSKRGLGFVKGITTNPSAMSKINHCSLSDWEKILPLLCEFVTETRGDAMGEVYVQAPVSRMTTKEVIAFARHISQFNDGFTKLGLKISPSLQHLEAVPFIQKYMPVNVTGVSDCCTALSCCLHDVDYVSIIPGRMEEVGIDADAHLKYLNRRNFRSTIITGSMRGIEGLKRAIELDTIPTIGTKVWDILMEEKTDFYSFKPDPNSIFSGLPMLSPHIDELNANLSTAFFAEMDTLGETVYKGFTAK
tara:strand:- start:1504 stop:2307 length:804 start_codon:yes stop_codon:yes gene_type:complete